MTNIDLKSQIKEMESKKRAETLSTSKVTFVKPDGEEDVLSYDEWWMIINKKIKFRPHMKEIILADFKGRGLSLLETLSRYDEALKLFGYKIDN